ncbi:MULTISPECIES: tyrosinase family protein [Kitasatospora]|uniref:Tyrosinase family protein n=1 Tax=Kitasatospora cathayae TaxID=3004092 RepID=A0ABY7PY94_9ACTN|nr:tyrosinase family protein [Kitasatospora sp. HUAS 3-15]WBP84966.1 tyrosinase family protein [Kitasatospora sp. HUAS 3-15]
MTQLFEHQLAALAHPDLLVRATAAHDGGPGPRTFADLAALRRAQPVEKVRKSEKDLTDTERSRLVGAFTVLNQSGDFGKLVAIHADMGHHQHRMTNAPDDLGARRFLPWHRVFVNVLETALQRIHSDVTVPYWDWTADQQVPDWLSGVLPTVVVPGAMGGVIRVTRSPGSQQDLRRRTAKLDEVMRSGDFMSFVDGLEHIHDLIHDWVGATMSDLSTAAADPLFFLHHANVDRLWWTWHVTHQNENPPLTGDDAVMDPWRVTEPTTRDIGNFHYSYR